MWLGDPIQQMIKKRTTSI